MSEPNDADRGPVVYGASEDGCELVIYGVHGRAQSPAFILELAERVGEFDRFRWVMPSAPEGSWFPQGFMAPVEDNRPSLDDGLRTVAADLGALLAGPAPVVALGFSQGACLLAEHLLTARPEVDGIVLHTGGYLGPEERTFGPGATYDGVPAAVLTAREDSWVPLHRSEETARALEALGADAAVSVYDDPEHHINDDAVCRIRELLERVAGYGTENAIP